MNYYKKIIPFIVPDFLMAIVILRLWSFLTLCAHVVTIAVYIAGMSAHEITKRLPTCAKFALVAVVPVLVLLVLLLLVQVQRHVGSRFEVTLVEG